jgi:anti-anti-sigma regulatory factor
MRMGVVQPEAHVACDASRTPGYVRLSGDLDVYAAADVERAFASLSGSDIIIDVRKVRIVASAFISALVHLRWRLPDSRIEVRGANDTVRRTFRAVGAEMFVTLAPP